METEESVQETTAPVADATGNSTESAGVSSAEPTAPAAESEPTAEASAESVPAPAEAFPEVDAFDWDSWDGSDYEAFPEQVRPWADRLNGHHAKSLDSLAKTNNTEVDYWKRMYEAMSYGEEDPRVNDLTSQLEALNATNTELQDKYATMERELSSEREAENDRYFKWFEKNYQGKLEQLAKSHGVKPAEEMVVSLMDLDMDVHVAVEVSLMGTEAIAAAKALSEQVKDSSLVLEILRNRFKSEDTKNSTASVQEEERPPNPAAQVVAGSAPVSRPAQLAKEKSPTYGGAGRAERMGAIMSAAENAIRKSKRR